MTNNNGLSIFSSIKNNYFIAFHLLKENWVPFAKTELFTVVCVAIIVIFVRIDSAILNFLNFKFAFSTPGFHLFIYFTLIVLVNLFFLTFLTSQFGLANDIFNSGHMYAEFSSSFSYYKKHRVPYTIVTFSIYWIQFLADPLSSLPIASLYAKSKLLPVDLTSISDYLTQANFIIIFLRQFLLGIFQIAVIILLVGILPSVSQNNSFTNAIRENFSILTNNKRFIIFTWLIYFSLFIFPEILVNVVLLLLAKYYFTNTAVIFLGFIHLTIDIAFLFIGMPVMALVATRMYGSLKTPKNLKN